MSGSPFLSRRIYGLETEFGVACRTASGRRIGADEIARYLFRSVVAWGKSSNAFLRNGSRVYLDVGSHPEYATAECATISDAVNHDRAGELILNDLAASALAQLADEEVDSQLWLFKNNTDSHGNSYGCHENYLIDRRRSLDDYVALLVPFLVSRQLICGAGKLLPDGRYVLAQRAEHMWDPVSSATTRMRPMINTRDEPHADPASYRRLHVIVGDSNMAEPSNWLKVGTTELVLRLIESRTALRNLSLENPARAIRELSYDLDGRAQVRLLSGRTVTGLELQETYLEAVLGMVEREGDPGPELRRVLELWQRVLVALRARDRQSLERDVDWAIKHKLLRRYAERHELAWNSARLAHLDLAYHDIAEDRGLLRLMEAKGQVNRYSDPAEIERATTEPPATRAALRSRFIDAAQGAGVDYTVDWTTLKVNETPRRPWLDARQLSPELLTPVLLKDPLADADARVDRLIEALPKP